MSNVLRAVVLCALLPLAACSSVPTDGAPDRVPSENDDPIVEINVDGGLRGNGNNPSEPAGSGVDDDVDGTSDDDGIGDSTDDRSPDASSGSRDAARDTGTDAARRLDAGTDARADSGTSGRVDGGASADGGSDAGRDAARQCVYPQGPFGKTKGSFVSSTIQMTGYAPNKTSTSSVKLSNFYDCDGSKNINAIYIVYGAGWCSGCKQEAAHIGQLAKTWAEKGIVVLSALTEDAAGQPASSNFIRVWRDTFKLSATYVCADPKLQVYNADYVPYQVLIDPRTMKIVATGQFADTTITSLAARNDRP